LDGCGGENSCDYECEQSIGNAGEEDCESNDGRNSIKLNVQTSSKKKGQQLREANGPLTIPQLLYEYPTCPPSAYVYIKEYLYNDNVNWMYQDNKSAKRDVAIWCSKLNWWTLKDYDDYYSDPKVKPYFNAYNRIQSEIYYDVDTSVEVASKLLLFQYNNDTETVHNFLTDVLNVIDKRIPKLNTLAIHAERNAGKNFFF